MKTNFKLFAFFVGLLHPFIGYSQSPSDTMHYWKKTAVSEIAFNQAALTNWQGGGQNTIAGSGFLHASAKYDRGFNQWYNKLEAAFGIVRLGKADQPFQKSDDGLELSTLYAHDFIDSGKPSKHWSVAVDGDFKTTFAPGYKYGTDANGKTVQQQLLSKFMSPGYLIIGAGIKYEKKDIFFVILSPVAARLTILTNDSMANAGAYGVDPGKHLRLQIGEDLKIGIKFPVMKNVVFETSLDMFGSYRHVQQQAVDWAASLTCKINSLLTANVGTHLIYDQDIKIKRDNGSIGPAVQFKEVIAIGVQYKLY